MATVYSLVCFGGLSGKDVTFTDTGDVVNLTNHGLQQGVTGIVFSSTGSLPTGVTAGTTYYSRNGADANKFTLYLSKIDALAGTNQVIFSGTGSGVHTIKSAYMLALTASDLTRYNGRIYASIYDWKGARQAEGVQRYDTEVCEIGEAFNDRFDGLGVGGLVLDLDCVSTLVTTKINGIRGGGFHRGNCNSGYQLSAFNTNYKPLITISSPSTTIDGIRTYLDGTVRGNIGISAAFVTVCNNILQSYTSVYAGYGIRLASGTVTIIYNNIIFGNISGGGTPRGIELPQYGGGVAMIYNNLIAKYDTGFFATTYTYGTYYNNIAIGNNTNWSLQEPAYSKYCTNNAGLATDTIWQDETGTTQIIATSDFMDFVNNDFRPATSGSPQVNSGINVYQGALFDICEDIRPNYEPTTYPNELWDIGPYEFNHGNGLAPRQVNLKISNIAEGSVLAVYKNSDDSEIVSPTTIGASGSYSATLSYTGDVPVTIKVRKGTSGIRYLPYESLGLISENGFSLIINQVEDAIAI